MREYHEVRKRLSEHPERSAPYVGYARTLLGELKADMAFNKLLQGVLRRSVVVNGLEVKIEVSSSFGRDEIRIFVPGSEEETKPSGKRKIKSKSPVVVGVYYKASPDTNAYVFMWRKGVGAVDISTGVAGATHYADGGISADGNTVAYTAYASAWAKNRVVRWTRSGIEYMTCSRNAWATQISADGNIISGTLGYSSEGFQRGFRWVHGKAYEQYEPATGDQYCRIWDMTPDGRFMTGQSASKPCYWEAGNPTPVLIPLPAGYTNEGQGRGISADGSRVVGYAFDSASWSSVAFMWDRTTGATRIGPYADYDSLAPSFSGMPAYISDDGKTVQSTLYRSADGATQPFSWTETGGIVPITSPAGSKIFDLAPDASMAVGSSFSNSVEYACLWDAKGFAFLDDPTGLLRLNHSAADQVAIVETEIEIPE